ncbi:MAG: tetratricopeptide repeat protein [Bacteroidota bacterium]|nr:tetratricopeptide repeat protein [Bacteroidota bacterium]
MNKPQWITLSIAFFLAIGLFVLTQENLFGERKITAKVSAIATLPNEGLSTDSILYYAKQALPPSQVAHLAQLEHSISRGDVAEQKLHLMHQLARFWSDSAKAFTPLAWYPYAYYTAEAARLENSKNSLSFAAHLILNALSSEDNIQVKQWDALQAKDLFERTLILDPSNDSAKVGLGAVILYGGLQAPMTGIAMIMEVVEKDSTNVFAQLTLAEASLLSGQLDKAVERLKKVVHLQPHNLKATLLLADTYEKMDKKEDAVQWYKTSLSFINNTEIKKEVEKRITELKTK